MKKRWACVALGMVVGCVPKIGQNNNEPATNNATISTNNATANTAGGDVARCVPALFSDSIPYDASDMLPFSFEIPAGFGNLAESVDGEVAGGTFDIAAGGSGEFLMHYSVSTAVATNKSGQMERWVLSGHEPMTIDFDGAELDAWTLESADVDETYFFLPFDGSEHVVLLEWRGPSHCVDQRRKITSVALRTLVPNDETTFPN